jgi:LacI family transcriptional regulator
MSKKKPVSLRDIARKAGVSTAAVSLALRDDASISPATRKRIRKMADRLGYQPDPRVARAMAAIAQSRHSGRHSDRIAFLTSDDTPDGWRNWPHDRRYFAGAEKQARVYGYSLEPVWALDPKLRGKKLSLMLWTQGVEGILLKTLGQGAWTGAGWKLDLDWDRFSVVELGETLDAPPLHRARHDHFSAALLLLESMEGLGYRRIGLAAHRQMDFWDRLDKDAFRRWLSAGKLDAVIGGTEGFYEAVLGMGFKIPSELGLGVVDRPSDYRRVALSGTDLNVEMTGAAGIDLLVGMIHRGERGVPAVPTQRICPGVWVNGRTTKRVGPPLGGPSLLHAMVPAVAE